MQGSGQLIDGRFRLEQTLGSGGMGVVYLAVDEELQRRVAVKLLRSAIVNSVEARMRLSREIEVLSSLHSPYIAEFYAAGFLPDKSPYYVMEYLEGRDLKAELRRRGPLPVAEATAYLTQACRGVAIAHAQGIVHRDLKPHNLILTQLDAVRRLKIVDFGVAKILSVADQSLTASDTAVGTPLYMCPEQLLNPKTTSTLADVWALGVILYEILAGFSPFADESPGAVVAAVTLDDPAPIRQVRPDLPEKLVQLIDRALQKVPKKRLASAEQFEQLLRPFATPLELLVVGSDSSAQYEGTIERPERIRRDVDLRLEIRESVDGAKSLLPDTLRRLRPALEDIDPNPAERRSLVPSLRHLSGLIELGTESASANGQSWLETAMRSHTVVAVFLLSVGAICSLGLLLGRQWLHHSPHDHIIEAPSRHAPAPWATVLPVVPLVGAASSNLVNISAPSEPARAVEPNANVVTKVNKSVVDERSAPGRGTTRTAATAPSISSSRASTMGPSGPLVPLHL